ncbi:MAG: hypothetical protein AUK35_05330 [Zetaproteobacteria bacterium CG2_30_46_52]|nr:MAG: hypothetical protein AUK35_05330 [Zetaproteobacteria bacterium CG2_30_46_52]
MIHTPVDKGLHATLAVRHLTRFEYSEPVAMGFSEVRMMPTDTPLQDVESAKLIVSPDCKVGHHIDYFGNHVHHFNVLAPHRHIEVVSEAVVRTSHKISGGVVAPDPRPSVQRHAEFLHWSKAVPKLDEYASITHKVDQRLSPKEFEESLVELAAYFFRNFRYDPDVTHVHSTAEALFTHGGGVCQDLAHAMIGVLRLAGIPARYVSGYIYDAPAESDGGEHLRGAAATHAWVQVWHPEASWCGIDPTNDKLVDWQYIRTAIGRDYYDVTPVKGIFRGNVEQKLTVEVEVTRLA